MRPLGAIALGGTVLVTAATRSASAAPRASPSVVQIRYLQNSGWLVLTPGHVLIFDYVDFIKSIDGVEALPKGTAPELDEYGTRRVVVFVTHWHADHYSPLVFDWIAKHPRIQYVVGVGVPSHGHMARVMSPHEDWSSDGLRVRTTGSTDEGVGFLVTADEITIFHAGDHALWDESGAEAFGAEIQWLQKQGATIDLALFPIATGFACEPRLSIWRGVQSAAVVLRPRFLIPMHVRCSSQLSLYERFRTEIGAQLAETQVVAPAVRGEWFQYEARVLRRKRADADKMRDP